MPENRIIKVKYSPDGYTKTRAAYQYDYGQVLRLEGFPEGMLPDPFEVHFSVGSGLAKTQIGTDSAVSVLDECLERYGTIAAWLFLHDTASDGETKYTIEIPVRSRSKTVDAPPTPVQQSAITQAIAALNDAVEQTVQDVADAQSAKEAAETAQEAAKDAADSVKNAGATATTLAPGSPATVVVEDVDGVKTFKFGIPQGPKGDPGEIPDISGKADKADTVLDTTLSRGRKANTNVGSGSVAFGTGVTASGSSSQAFGFSTTASGTNSHAIGYSTKASGHHSFASGYLTEAAGRESSAGGWRTIAKNKAQHVFGECNVPDPSESAETERGMYVEIVGNGINSNNRSNARTLDWNGNEELAGDLVINKGGTKESSMSDVAEDVNSLKSAINLLEQILPTEETGQDLLDEERKNAGLTETALAVIGLLFDRIPQDESAVDIYHSLVLENERLLAIYEIWNAERSA